MGGAFGLTLIMIFFWMPETAYVRTGATNLDTGSKTDINLTDKLAAHHLEDGEKSPPIVRSESPERSLPQEAPHSFAKNVLPYSGYLNHVSFWNTIIRPFMMLGSPVVLWATLLFTTCISWLVGISITLSQIFSAPPYNFSVTAVGLTNLSAFAASLLATLIAGPLIDGLVKKMSMRNGGTFGSSHSSRVHSALK
jgi:hypothetical protein